MDGSGLKVTWCPIKCSVPKAQQKAKNYFSTGEQLSADDGRAFCSKILQACAMIHPKGPAKGSKQHPCRPLTKNYWADQIIRRKWRSSLQSSLDLLQSFLLF